MQGRVQGVFFRQSTRDIAVELGLAGWVRNMDDGSVEIEAIGSKEALEKLIVWCQSGGPPSARVDNVDVNWSDLDAEDGISSHFRITR